MAIETGLTSAQVAQLAREGKANMVPSKSSMSVAGIVARNVFTYFNAIFALLAVLVIIAGSFKSLTFLPVIVANTIIGIVQQLRAKKVLDELALLDVSEYTVIRDGQDVRVASDALVLGDLVRLESGQQIPADAIVVSGEAGVNESLLTGEADEIQKAAGDELMSGSFVAAGKIVARLVRVGADSYASQLTTQAKQVKERPSQMVADIERIILAAGILVIPVGGLLYWQGMGGGMSVSEAIMSMVGAVIGMIPEGLYLLVTVALALSAMRLAKNKVLLHDMRSIEELARVDVLCVDKTGTITSDQMNVREIFDAAGATLEHAGVDEGFDGIELRDVEGGASVSAAVEGGRTLAVPARDADALILLARYVRTVPDSNATMNAVRDYLPETEPFENADVTPFSSKHKYSQVITEGKTFRLGAPEFILNESAMRESRQALEERAGAGMRVLAFAEVDGGETRALLFVAISNSIRDNAPETFEEFARQGVEVKVISGDNPLTVSKVAEEARIEGAERYVDASTLDTPEKIAEAVGAYTVFGRVKPEQKKQLVEALQATGKKVAMTGDGVNDILAMKESDCSVAMAAGSDAAVQASQLVLLESDFAKMPAVVDEGRRVVNNLERSGSFYLVKNVFSFLIAAAAICIGFTYPLLPLQITLIGAFTIGIPSFFLAQAPNKDLIRGDFLMNVFRKALPGGIADAVTVIPLVLIASGMGLPQAEIRTAATVAVSAIGMLVHYGIAKPLDRYKGIVFALCGAGQAVTMLVLHKLLELVPLSAPAALLSAGAFVLAVPIWFLLGKALEK